MDKTVTGAIGKASEKYAETLSLRALIQVIPWVGGAVDTLLGGRGSRISQRRIEDFLRQLQERLQKVEKATTVEPSEEFFDLMMGAFDGVLRSRSELKRGQFATLIANQVRQHAPWEEAETALHVLSDLSDSHLRVLLAALNAEPCAGSFTGLKVVTVADEPIGKGEVGHPALLTRSLPEYSTVALRLICSELVARGLLHDEGIGRLGARSMQYFVATDTAAWLIRWIGEHDGNTQQGTGG
jgi:hypothetical protein